MLSHFHKHIAFANETIDNFQSTTVSATSSPNCDQQELEENRELLKRSNIRGTELTFKAVDDMYPTVQPPHMFQQQNSTSSSSNGIEEASPKKKPRKQQL